MSRRHVERQIDVDVISQHSYRTDVSRASKAVSTVSRASNASRDSRNTANTTVTSNSAKEGKDRKYYDLAKKLYEEKKELKKLLKKTVNDYKKTMAKDTDAHKEQIQTLMKERDLLLKQTENHRKLLASFNSEKTTNKRLEETIVDLQEKLSEEEQRNMRIDAELKEQKEKFSAFQREKIQKHNSELASLKKDYEQRFFDIEQQQKAELERIRQIYTEQNTDLRSEAQRCRNEMESIRQEHLRFFSNIPNDDQGIKRLYNEILEYKQSISHNYARKEDEINRKLEKERVSLKTTYEKTIAELKDVNNRQIDQIANLRETVRKVQETVHHSSNEIINSLTTQKKNLERQVQVRDGTISQLNQKLKAVAEESVNEMNAYEIKVTNLQSELQNITEKYESIRQQYEKLNNNGISFMGELRGYKELQHSLQQKIEELQLEKEKLEFAFTQRQQEYDKYRKDSVKLFELENKYKDEVTEFNKIIAVLKIENEELKSKTSAANSNLESEKYKNTKIHTLLQQVQNKNNVLEMEIGKKDLVLNSLKQELESLQVVYNNLQSENIRQKTFFQEEVNQKISALDDQRKSELRALAKKNTDLENIVKLMKKEVDKYKQSVSNIEKERDAVKASLEFYTKPENDYKAKIDFINNLQSELVSATTKYNASIGELNKQIQGKEKEIDELTRKLKTVENKDAQIQNLTSQLSKIQDNYKTSFAKLTNDHVKDRKDLAELRAKEQSFIDQGNTIKKLQEEIISIQEVCNNEIKRHQNEHKEQVIKLNREITELQVVMAQCDQKIELNKLGSITQLTEGKRIRAELENKLQSLEQKNHDLSILLNSTENKYAELQGEYAKAVQSINIEKRKLDERFQELSKYEKEIRDAPPKLLDPSLRQARDEALNKMREMKGTIAELTEKLKGYEEAKKELREKTDKLDEMQKLIFSKFTSSS